MKNVLLGLVVMSLFGTAASSRGATLTVTSTADSGAGTLRQALVSAADGDTIDATGITGTILLTTGELLVTNSATILGSGPNNLAVDGNAASRVFHIGLNTVVSISGLTITNGKPFGPSFPIDYTGAGILNEQATLTLSNCAVTGNNGLEAICNYGANGNVMLTMVKCIVSDNPDLAILNFGSLSNVAILTIGNSAISNNSQGYRGCGVTSSASDNGVAMLTISNCIISGNSAGLDGGGILNFGEQGGRANADISCSSINGNSAVDDGGGIANEAGSGSATMTINNSTLSGNSTTNIGGGWYCQHRCRRDSDIGDCQFKLGWQLGLPGRYWRDFPNRRRWRYSKYNAGLGNCGGPCCQYHFEW